MVNATSVAKNERWIGGVAYILALSVELTGGAARLPAVGAKNWPFGTLVAVELVLPPRCMLSPIPCLVSGKKDRRGERGAQGLRCVLGVAALGGGAVLGVATLVGLQRELGLARSVLGRGHHLLSAARGVRASGRRPKAGGRGAPDIPWVPQV